MGAFMGILFGTFDAVYSLGMAIGMYGSVLLIGWGLSWVWHHWLQH